MSPQPSVQVLTLLRKAPQCGAFLVSVLCFSQPLHAAQAQACQPAGATRSYQVASVVDGDTLRLQDGRRVRLIGLDTPELGRDGRADAPYALAARSALQALIEASDHRVLLEPGVERRDRHRRLLAHLHTNDGRNLTAELLRQGLGYQAVVPPNLTHLGCYRQAERDARSSGLALWSREIAQAADAADAEPGFHLLQGRVVRIGTSQHAVWLNLQGGLSVKVPWKVWREMTGDQPEDVEGRRLEVRGWFYRHRGRLKLTLSHPASLRWL